MITYTFQYKENNGLEWIGMFSKETDYEIKIYVVIGTKPGYIIGGWREYFQQSLNFRNKGCGKIQA